MTRRNVVFLDFDGVLVNRQSLMQASGIHAKAAPECVAVLNQITEAANAVIVVSSTWRSLFSFNDLCKTLHGWGVTADCIGVTPEIGHRGQEILEWLTDNSNRSLVKDFVILDDDDDMDPYMHKLVRTEFESGLRPEHLPPALARLSIA
jgi:hypothetical protein